VFEAHEGPAPFVVAGVRGCELLAGVDFHPIHEDLRPKQAPGVTDGHGVAVVVDADQGEFGGRHRPGTRGPEGVRGQLPKGGLLECPGLDIADPLPLAPGAQMLVQRLEGSEVVNSGMKWTP